ncbi:LytTR family DNA-binding domain-containing protein [Blautia schinkii]|nr:LytTR family DNA-binding domain-containing protein [Blautia schinkii]
MIKVMILDDEQLYLDKQKQITEKYFAEKGIPCEIDIFLNAEWFLCGLDEEIYDLYILDVEMPGMNGIQVAKEIRKRYPEPVIIFVTNYLEYAVEAYEVNTYRYIPKMALDTKLPQAYDALLPEIMEKEERYYIIEKKGELEKIAYSDIFYLKKEGKYVVFVHRRGESRVRKSLKLVQEELDSDEFLLVDKGYVANIRHVMKLKGYDLYLRDGMILPVGTARFGQVKQAIVDFWR